MTAEQSNIGTAHEQFWRMLRILNLISRPYYEFVRKPYELPLPQFWVLRCLLQQPGITAQEISEFQAMPNMTTSRSVAHLVQKQLVTRVPDAQDKRRIKLYLTDQGQVLIDKLYTLAVDQGELVFGGLSRQERKALDTVLKRISERIRAASWEVDSGGNLMFKLSEEVADRSDAFAQGDNLEELDTIASLREENRHLRQIVADLMLQNRILSKE